MMRKIIRQWRRIKRTREEGSEFLGIRKDDRCGKCDEKKEVDP